MINITKSENEYSISYGIRYYKGFIGSGVIIIGLGKYTIRITRRD